MHEIGHTIGLKHNDHCEEAIMYYRYNEFLRSQRISTAKLHITDQLQIKCLYGDKSPVYKRREFVIAISIATGFLLFLIFYQILQYCCDFIPRNDNWMTKPREASRGLRQRFETMIRDGASSLRTMGSGFSRKRKKPAAAATSSYSYSNSTTLPAGPAILVNVTRLHHPDESFIVGSGSYSASYISRRFE